MDDIVVRLSSILASDYKHSHFGLCLDNDKFVDLVKSVFNIRRAKIISKLKDYQISTSKVLTEIVVHSDAYLFYNWFIVFIEYLYVDRKKPSPFIKIMCDTIVPTINTRDVHAIFLRNLEHIKADYLVINKIIESNPHLIIKSTALDKELITHNYVRYTISKVKKFDLDLYETGYNFVYMYNHQSIEYYVTQFAHAIYKYIDSVGCFVLHVKNSDINKLLLSKICNVVLVGNYKLRLEYITNYNCNIVGGIELTMRQIVYNFEEKCVDSICRTVDDKRSYVQYIHRIYTEYERKIRNIYFMHEFNLEYSVDYFAKFVVNKLLIHVGRRICIEELEKSDQYCELSHILVDAMNKT